MKGLTPRNTPISDATLCEKHLSLTSPFFRGTLHLSAVCSMPVSCGHTCSGENGESISFDLETTKDLHLNLASQ